MNIKLDLQSIGTSSEIISAVSKLVDRPIIQIKIKPTTNCILFGLDFGLSMQMQF